ncbi:hypothetical protein RR48_12050 [Papilio machaon]|uniref:Uncharacterized protein n=1 Tax=Papilio machaon TaxID=76193 RepID=A0A194RKY2_PAPMA|nr:hypothetical protein RR48_12050 [Papilio machaon]
MNVKFVVYFECAARICQGQRGTARDSSGQLGRRGTGRARPSRGAYSYTQTINSDDSAFGAETLAKRVLASEPTDNR